MIIIENRRPGFLLLPQSKLTLKPHSQVTLVSLTSEIEHAVKAGWVRIVDSTEAPAPDNQTGNPPSASVESPGARPSAHDWRIDYSQAETGVITITDVLTGRSLPAEIAERKGEQHYTLKSFGTVKAQQFWPTAQALERYDATE